MATTYKALVGMNYPGADGQEKRVEAGHSADDMPAKSIKWLLDQGLIEVVAEPAAPTPTAPAATEAK